MVLRTSAGEDLAAETGCSAGVNKLLWWPSHSVTDIELSMADCRARGVSHSFGIAFSMNGIHELTYASRFIQLGSSLPHRIYHRNTICYYCCTLLLPLCVVFDHLKWSSFVELLQAGLELCAKLYVTGSETWQVKMAIQQAETRMIR